MSLRGQGLKLNYCDNVFDQGIEFGFNFGFLGLEKDLMFRGERLKSTHVVRSVSLLYELVQEPDH